MSLPTTLAQLRNPMFNGHEISRTSCDLLFDTLNVKGWTEWNHKFARAPGMGYGSRSTPQTRTRGKVTYTHSITVYETTWNIMMAFLAAKGASKGLGWGEVSVSTQLTMFEPTLWPSSKVIETAGTQVIENELAVTDDDGQLVRKLTLSSMQILEDGLPFVIERGIPGF